LDLTSTAPKRLATFPKHADRPVTTPKLWECCQGQAEGDGRWGLAWSCVLGYSPVLRDGFSRAGVELPWPEGNSDLCGTQHAILSWPCTKRLTHSQSKMRAWV